MMPQRLHAGRTSRLVTRVARRARTAARAALALAESVWTAPDPIEPVAVRRTGPATPWTPDRPLRILSWNVQFCAGRRRRFFYDGGPDVRVPPAEVWPIIDAIGAVLRDEQADVVLLQEVDRRSDRTGRIDQHEELLARLRYPCHLSAAYHQNAYVPHPRGAHLGRMDLHLSVFSRFPIADARRIALPSTRSGGWLRQQFDLRRAIVEADLIAADGGRIRVGNLHLAAFTRGDGTLDAQVRIVHDRLAQARAQGLPAVLAGDFNALPPDDDPLRLGPQAIEYAADGAVLQPLFADFVPVVSREAHQDEPERWRTYLPPSSVAPDRALDHAFATGFEVLDATVLSAYGELSDHLPLRFELAPSSAAENVRWKEG